MLAAQQHQAAGRGPGGVGGAGAEQGAGPGLPGARRQGEAGVGGGRHPAPARDIIGLGVLLLPENLLYMYTHTKTSLDNLT